MQRRSNATPPENAREALPRGTKRLAQAIVFGLTLVRLGLVFAPGFDLMPQDTYYVTYADYPSWSYFDHPPMIGVLLWIAVHVFGRSTIGIRLGIFLATALTTWLVHRLAKRFLGAERAWIATALFASTGAASILSLMTIPDVPLLIFWGLALLALERAVLRGQRGAWLLAGLAMGLSFDSKYTAIFLPIGLALFLVLSKRHRRLLLGPWPWLSLLVMQLASFPVYWWNYKNDFASFAFQSVERAANAGGFSPRDIAGFVLAQTVVLLLPFFAWTLVRGIAWTARELPTSSEAGERRLFLACFCAPVLGACLLISMTSWVKVNWPMPAWIAGAVLAATVVSEALSAHRLLRRQLAASVLLHVVLVVGIVVYPWPIESDTTWFGWRRLAERIEPIADRHPDAFLFSADGYKTTAELAFYLDRKTWGMNILGWNALHYEYIGDDLDALRGRDALFVRSEARLRPGHHTDRLIERAELFFESVEERETIEIHHRGRLARLFRVFYCHGYRGPDAVVD